MFILEAKEDVDSILSKYGKDQSSIISILQEIQKEYRYLPKEVLEYISRKWILVQPRYMELQHFMRTFPWIQKENILSRFVMVLHVILENRSLYWRH